MPTPPTIPLSTSNIFAALENRVAQLEAAFDESSGSTRKFFWPMDCTNQVTPIVTANNIYGTVVPFDMTVTEIQASLRIPAASGTFTVRVKIGGVSVFSTNLTIDANETSSLVAATPHAISNSDWSIGDELTVDVVDDADGTASGLIITVISEFAPSDLFAPSTPAAPTVTPDGSTEMDIAWLASTDNVGVTGYTLQRALNSGFSVGLATFPLGNVLSYHDSGLVFDTQYFYRVKARDAAGNFSAYGATGSGVTGGFTPLEAFSWLVFSDAETESYANGADVTNFADHSGNNDDWVPTVEAPIFATSAALLNNKKAINFDNENCGLQAITPATGQCTIFIVGYIPALVTSNYNILWGDMTTAGEYALGIALIDGTWRFTTNAVERLTAPFTAGKYIIRIEHRATETRVFINGVDVTDDATSTKKPGGVLTLGQLPAWGFGFFDDTFIGIAACSNGLITGANADLCEEYWAARYGITLP